VAGVGLNEREARARCVRHEVAKLPFGQVARAIELDETAGTMKVLIDPETERILGASCAPRSSRASPWSSTVATTTSASWPALQAARTRDEGRHVFRVSVCPLALHAGRHEERRGLQGGT